MRVTTRSATTVAVAGLAAVLAGCSSGSSSSAPPVVHHVTTAKPAAQAAAAPAVPANPKAALAAAVRASLAAHSVQFRYLDTIALVHPESVVENINPYFTEAGVANFDTNSVTVNVVNGQHAAQPFYPTVTTVVSGADEFQADTAAAINAGKWAKAVAAQGDGADVQITQVMQDIKGPVTIVGHSADVTKYQVQSNLSQLLTDQGAGNSGIVRSLAGTTQTENVWVNRDGLITAVRWTLDPGAAHISGLDPAKVRAAYISIDFSNYGVDVVVPPHPTA